MKKQAGRVGTGKRVSGKKAKGGDLGKQGVGGESEKKSQVIINRKQTDSN